MDKDQPSVCLRLLFLLIAEVEIGKRERFIRFAGIARLFTFAAGIEISVCADVQVGIVGLGGPLLRGGFGFGALAGFAVRLFGVGLFGFAGEIALRVAVCAGAGGVQTVARAGMAGGIACLQNGSGRQMLSTRAQTSRPQPSGRSHGNLEKNLFMRIVRPKVGTVLPVTWFWGGISPYKSRRSQF